MTQSRAPAAGSSFYTAMRILPTDQRLAMYCVYGFCRAVDDIADATGPVAERMTELERWRADIAALFDGIVPSHLGDLHRAIRRYDLKRPDFDAIIDGMEMDVCEGVRAPDWSTLDLYCDRVASAVGRLCVRIFGLSAEPGEALAHHLGRALQLTNILRDIDEDAAIGRLYLPREALAAAGLSFDNPAATVDDPKIAGPCFEVAERARQHFREADRIMDAARRAAVRAPRLMAAAYGSLLDEMVKSGFMPPRKRAHVSKLRMLAAILRYAIL
ncbi:MAG: presqualene diphosphate synthase HpnD [Hyphomicrobiales bacterium]|nr:presqualene diphosphate synthase HpnD [Hyphomicrobiales bacterium]